MRTVIVFLFALKHVDMEKCKLKNDHNYWTFKGEIYKNCWWATLERAEQPQPGRRVMDLGCATNKILHSL